MFHRLTGCDCVPSAYYVGCKNSLLKNLRQEIHSYKSFLYSCQQKLEISITPFFNGIGLNGMILHSIAIYEINN